MQRIKPSNDTSKGWFFLLVIVLLTAPLAQSWAQNEDRNLEETLQMLSQDAAKQYLEPISSAFGTNLNSGWFHRATKPAIFSFNFEVGLVGMGAMYPDDKKSFSTSGQFRFSQAEARMLVTSEGQNYSDEVEDYLVGQITENYYTVGISGATIIGDPEDYITIKYPGYSYSYQNETYDVPSQEVMLDIGGFKELAKSDVLPLAVPQLSIGTIYGTRATFRYLPDTEFDEELGALKYFGFGLQHNPAVFLPDLLPFSVSASFFTQTLEIGDLFKSKTKAFGINASKQFGPRALNITPYAGFMLETSEMQVTYDFIVETPAGPQSTQIQFDLEGENKSRLTFGLNLRFGIFNINADYNIGQYNAFSAGAFIAI